MNNPGTFRAPAISVIVPMRNEAEAICGCLESLLSQTIPISEYEIVVVDGMSDDGSYALVSNLQARFPNVVLLTNPARVMPAGMNIGLSNACAPVVVVAGAHTSYPSSYLENCLAYLDKTGADVVGGPLLTTALDHSFVPRMICAILSSRFGVGNAAFRTGMKEGWVDTVPYGAYRKQVFERCGIYNERLVRAQDSELHARIRHNGGRIYQTPALLTHYHPVSTFRALWRKAFLDGEWQCFAAVQNPQSFSLRRFVPALMLLLLFGASVLAFFVPGVWLVLAILFLSYILTGIFFGSTQTGRSDLLTRFALPFCAFPFHVCYGAGTLVGLLRARREPALRTSTHGAGPLDDKTVPSER